MVLKRPWGQKKSGCSQASKLGLVISDPLLISFLILLLFFCFIYVFLLHDHDCWINLDKVQYLYGNKLLSKLETLVEEERRGEERQRGQSYENILDPVLKNQAALVWITEELCYKNLIYALCTSGLRTGALS